MTIPNTLSITAYIHCGKCLDEWKNNKEISSTISPKDYSRTQAGFTAKGIQVWCNRHNCNVVHIDFQGQQHPANLTAKKEGDDENQS